jgi:outer membrane protein assembly factor BamB
MRKNTSRVFLNWLGVVSCTLLPFQATLVHAQDAPAEVPATDAPAAAVPAPGAPAVAAPPTTDTPVAGTTVNAAPSNWTLFNGDLQRTSARNVTLPMPLNALWRYTAEGEPASTTPPLVTGPAGQRRIYFAAGTQVFCIDGQTGSQIWKSAVLTRPVTAPLTLLNSENGDLILAVTSGGRMSALRTSDGGQAWEADARSPVPSMAPTILKTSRGDRILLGISLGRLLAFTTEGALDPNWEVKLGRTGSEPTATPAITPDGKYLFLAAQDQRLYCIDVQTGSVVYTIQLNTSALSSPVVVGDQVIVAAGQIVTGYRIRTGDPIWRTNTESRQIDTAPAVRMDAQGNPVVYIGAKNGIMYAIDARPGKGDILWKTDLESSVSSTATVLNNAILVATSRGVLYALKPEDGSIQWQYRLRTERAVTPNQNTSGRFNNREVEGGGAQRWRGNTGGFATTPTLRTFGVSAAPAVVDNQVFVVGDNAAVYAFDTNALDAVPPRVVEPSLSVPSAEGPLFTQLLGDRPIVVPGRAPVYFAAQLEDAGSGVNPDTIRVVANSEAIPKERAVFQTSSSVLTVTLNGTQAGNVRVNLPDGAFNINITAQDYQGNRLNYTGTFNVDNATPPPSSEQQPFRGGRNRRGQGGRGNWNGGQGGFGGQQGGFGGQQGGFGGQQGGFPQGGDGGVAVPDEGFTGF